MTNNNDRLHTGELYLPRTCLESFQEYSQEG